MARRLLIDETPLGNLNQNSFRAKIGYVPQDPILFQGSIRDNLVWSAPDATDDDLWTALRLANSEHFVKNLPEGIFTVVGDRGTRLSGGQRQRIALARALVRKPDLLILDKATSALDAESEGMIQSAIDGLGNKCTILIIAHRLSTIVKADQIYVLQGGCVIEQVTFQTLSENQSGPFSRMVAAQRESSVSHQGIRSSEIPIVEANK